MNLANLNYLKGLLDLAPTPFSDQQSRSTVNLAWNASSAAYLITEWEEKINRWSASPSDSEQERIDRTVRMVTEAINNSAVLSRYGKNVVPFLQGSYRNQTNIRVESDIDICVVFNETVSFDSAPATPYSAHQHHLPTQPPAVTPHQFRGMLQAALSDKFGNTNVIAGNKALLVRASTARVNADIVPAVPYQYFYSDKIGIFPQPRVITGGFAIYPKSGGTILNWPHHHFNAGVTKNSATGGRYKMIVRF